MKKCYEAPVIHFEDFSLNMSIAGNCEAITSNPNQAQSCAYIYEDERGGSQKVFLENITGCDYKPQGGNYNGLCYHVPTESNNVFNS